MINNRFLIRSKELIRRAIRLIDWENLRDREYNFARRYIIGNSARILDVGACESLLPLYLAKNGFKVTAFDFRKYLYSHSNLINIKGDFLNNSLPDNYYDYVVLISTIEHIGFGSYGAPIYEDGDFKTMSEVKRILKPDGKIVITFPFTDKHTIIQGFERWYDINRVKNLFEGLNILAEEYYIPTSKLLGRWGNFAPASLEQIKQVKERLGYPGCACYLVSLVPRNYFL